MLDSSKEGKYIYNGYILDYEPFYIGKGCGKRFKDTMYDTTSFKRNKIEKLKNNGIKIITLKLVENLSNDDAINIEMELINLIGRRDLKMGPLINLTDGGEGRTNSTISIETRNKISKTKRDNPNYWNHTEETKTNMSINQVGYKNNFFGKRHTQETKVNHSLKISGSNHPMYGKKNPGGIIKKEISQKMLDVLKQNSLNSRKEVIMFSLSMDKLCEFESVKEASSHTKISESVISKSCRGEIKKPKRYYFKYKNMKDANKQNSYLIKDGDEFIHHNEKYILFKRNVTSAICIQVSDGEHKTIRYIDCKSLEIKDTNDSDFQELRLYLESILDDVEVHQEDMMLLSESNKIKIFYNKLHINSDIFKDKKYIFNRYETRGEYTVINIFEDTWLSKKDIVKSRIRNALNKTEIKIYARKCVVKVIKDASVSKAFLAENHMQSWIRSKLALGLYYNDELVSIMAFGSLRKNLGQSNKDGSWELLRFASKLGVSVIGGASKLFKYFTTHYEYNVLISYADRCWSNGELYQKLGMTISKNKIMPSYFYIIDGVRKNRFAFRKDILVSEGFDSNMTEVSIQHSRGYYRIFDCGCFKYELIK